ncbi:hypothetical protein DSM106972_055880 [Dulcicalothrix desertica PCC 7102]|uniref:Uncharacterized protein n=2 Tax=Dulcicalothrix desertica TaxID=32056 RepID=A0A3S1AL28_9CYAN|nr:hypothetical protein DSM106972_055880 [Dulcicalothrix desertica PCC 7102]
MENGESIEVGTVGNEGMAGLPIFLGATTIPGEAFSQVPGSAMRMKASVFRREVTPGNVIYSLLQRYTQALFNQVAQSTACNRLHSIEERFCRWMLMTQDRVGSNEFPMTHEFLGQMRLCASRFDKRNCCGSSKSGNHQIQSRQNDNNRQSANGKHRVRVLCNYQD